MPFKIARLPVKTTLKRVFSEAWSMQPMLTLSSVKRQTIDNVARSRRPLDLAFNLTVPGAYTPTMTTWRSNLPCRGNLIALTSLWGCCGSNHDVDMDLSGSTFGAVPWEDRTNGFAASCETPKCHNSALGLEDCPALQEGTNTSFPSGGLQREFEVQLPLKHPRQEWPIVFAWHGFGVQQGSWR